MWNDLSIKNYRYNRVLIVISLYFSIFDLHIFWEYRWVFCLFVSVFCFLFYSLSKCVNGNNFVEDTSIFFAFAVAVCFFSVCITLFSIFFLVRKPPSSEERTTLQLHLFVGCWFYSYRCEHKISPRACINLDVGWKKIMFFSGITEFKE